MSGSDLKLENLLPEKKLATALGISKATLAKYRSSGCPYLRMGGRLFYLEEEFMTWVAENCHRTKDEEISRSRRKKRGSE